MSVMNDVNDVDKIKLQNTSVKTKEKKIYFSKEIDSRINGFSLIIAFIGVGVLLQFCPDYFGNSFITKFVKILFIIFGVLGFISELINKEKTNKILGIDNLAIGLFFTGLWLFLFLKFNHWVANTLSFFMLIIGLYGVSVGIQQIIYSFYINVKKKSKIISKSEWFISISKLAGFILVIFQIFQITIDIIEK